MRALIVCALMAIGAFLFKNYALNETKVNDVSQKAADEKILPN